MILYCWRHNGTHRFTDGETERIVYAMTAELLSPFDDADRAQGIGYSESKPPCPQEALEIARDTEMAYEHVEQGVACRLAGA